MIVKRSLLKKKDLYKGREIKKVFTPLGIKHISKKLNKAKFEVLVFIPLSKSTLFRTVWRVETFFLKGLIG